MNNLEILAPAGSMDSLIAGVKSGADAIYLGTTQFGARASAHNFDFTQLKKATEFCHKRDVKLYLTMNTLITDNELPIALDIAKKAYELCIDAIIVQDIGFADLLHKSMPDLHLHASTQMSIHTSKGAEFLYNLGFTRVVLSREMSLIEIKEVSESCPVELEVFVHGALCMCVSGQCYFSSILGSRSGNRGQCAQTCRLPFTVESGSGHDLSLKDMSILENLQELRNIGVTSAKIEGRLKRPEYVASAVNVARQFLDNGYADENSCNQLKSVFSRSGFTDGYYKAKRNSNMFGTRQKDDVVSATSKILNQIHSIYKNEYQRIPVEFDFSLKKDTPAYIKAFLPEKNISAECFGNIGEKAVNKPLTCEKAINQLSKTGNSPFKVTSIKCNIQKNSTVPISSLNSMRREITYTLTENILKTYKTGKIKDITILQNNNRKQKNNIPLRAIFNDWDIPLQFSKCEIIFIPENTPTKIIKELKSNGFNLGIEIFGGMFGREKKICNTLEILNKIGVKNILINNLGAIPLCKEFGFKIYGNFRLNVMNSQSILFLKNSGLTDVTSSFELTLQQINSLANILPTGAIIYGNLPLMLTRNCPGYNSKTKTCADCGGMGFITDRKNINFPYKCNGGCTQIFNSVPLYMGDRLDELSFVDFYTMLFTTENTQQKLYVLECIKNNEKINSKHTRGLYYKGVL